MFFRGNLTQTSTRAGEMRARSVGTFIKLSTARPRAGLFHLADVQLMALLTRQEGRRVIQTTRPILSIGGHGAHQDDRI